MDKRRPEIKRPPFGFDISEEFADLINSLVDAIENGEHVRQAGLEQEVWAARRELAEGSDAEDWILGYYYERGWQSERHH